MRKKTEKAACAHLAQAAFFPRKAEDNVGWLTALANDLSYEQVFVQQLINFASPGDLLLAISGSGNSRNVLAAVEWGRANGLTTVGLTGFDGERLLQLAHHSVHVPADDMGIVETVHLGILHWILDDVFGRIHRTGRYASVPRC